MPDRSSDRCKRWCSVPALAVFAASTVLPVHAQQTEANTVVASLNPVPEGLSCGDAAAQAQVSFDFEKPDFDIRRISLYVDGQGVPGDAVVQQWPRVTLTQGLHPGRNTVEIVAIGDGGRSIARQLTVLIGVPPKAGDDAAAVVRCDNSRVVVASTPPAEVDDEDYDDEDAPPTIIERTVYVDQPVYVYHEYPAYPVWPVVVPIIPVIIGAPPPPVWYAPPPYYRPPVTYYPRPPPYRPPPPVYRGPPHEPPPGSNLYRTPNPVGRVPQPIGGTPVPLQPINEPLHGTPRRPPEGGHYRTPPPSGGGAVITNGPSWGTVRQMNPGGDSTRYRTPAPGAQPAPPQRRAPEGGSYSTPHGQQSRWDGAGGRESYRPPARTTFVREAAPPRVEAPRPMPPARMNAAPPVHMQAPREMPQSFRRAPPGPQR